MGRNDITMKNPTNQAEYYNFIQNYPQLKIQNMGLAVSPSNQTQSGLSFNTGQMYNKQQEMPNSNTMYADGTKAQSNFVNLPNQQQEYQKRKY